MVTFNGLIFIHSQFFDVLGYLTKETEKNMRMRAA